MLTMDLPPFPAIAWRGIFGKYRELMMNDPVEPGTPVSECPEAFHYANLLSLIAAELSDKVRLDEGASTFPNFFVFCCGRTGTKKSTASDLVYDYVARQFPDTAFHHTASSMSSAEGLIRTLMERPNLRLVYDEIKDLFVLAGRTGSRLESVMNKGLSGGLLEANVRRASESLRVEGYYLNVLANGTPTHVLDDLSETFFKGGMLNRFLVFAANPTDIIKPHMGMPDAALAKEIGTVIYNRCLAWRVFAPARGQIRVGFTPEASELHRAWYTKHSIAKRDMTDLEADPLTRLDVFAKKIAMVYALIESEPCEHPLITAPQEESALSVIEYAQASMSEITKAWTGPKSVARQSEGMVEQRVEQYLKRRGCTLERLIHKSLHVSSTEVAKVINALVAQDVVVVTTTPPKNARTVHFMPRCVCDGVA